MEAITPEYHKIQGRLCSVGPYGEFYTNDRGQVRRRLNDKGKELASALYHDGFLVSVVWKKTRKYHAGMEEMTGSGDPSSTGFSYYFPMALVTALYTHDPAKRTYPLFVEDPIRRHGIMLIKPVIIKCRSHYINDIRIRQKQPDHISKWACLTDNFNIPDPATVENNHSSSVDLSVVMDLLKELVPKLKCKDPVKEVMLMTFSGKSLKTISEETGIPYMILYHRRLSGALNIVRMFKNDPSIRSRFESLGADAASLLSLRGEDYGDSHTTGTRTGDASSDGGTGGEVV